MNTLYFSLKVRHELCRLVKRIYCYSKAIVEKLRNNSCKKWATNFKTGVSICFYEVNFEIFINHEIVSENLKTVLNPIWVDLRSNRPEWVCNQSLHLREEITHEVHVSLRVVLVQISLEIVDWKLISTFKFTIILWRHLDGIVCQMNEFAMKIAQVKLFWWCSEIAISVHVAFQNSIYRCHHGIASDIKFPAMYQERSIDVFLHNRGPAASIRSHRLHYWSDFRDRICDLNSSTSVWIFTWLDDPNIEVSLLFKVLESFDELRIFWIWVAWRLYVESQGNCNLKRIDTNRVIVVADVSEEGLLIWKMVVVV